MNYTGFSLFSILYLIIAEIPPKLGLMNIPTKKERKKKNLRKMP